jgi:hypothetical protein
MSIQANFASWCQLRGLNPKPAAYLNDDNMWDLREGDARIIRMVDRKERAGNRETQTYIVEVLVNDTISYPLGTKPMEKKELLRRMIRSTMERSA